MHTHTLILLLTSFLPLALAVESYYAQPWYADHKYAAWRRHLAPPCTDQAIQPGDLCRDNGELIIKPPSAVASRKKIRFYHFLSSEGESRWFWSLGGGDKEKGEEKGKGKDEKNRTGNVSGAVKNATVDAEEEKKKKEKRDTIYLHHNTYFGPRVHHLASSGSDA